MHANTAAKLHPPAGDPWDTGCALLSGRLLLLADLDREASATSSVCFFGLFPPKACKTRTILMGIYVEVLIRAPMEVLWQHTQDPSLHQRWDLRFSTIRYLPRSDDEPQRFLYTTRIGFGFQIAGKGESAGERDLPGGCRVSSLKFSSERPAVDHSRGERVLEVHPHA